MSALTPPLEACRQLICVLAADWQQTSASLQYFEGSEKAWRAAGPAIAVTLGRSGLAWGVGLHTAVDRLPRTKIEGDGCAPAGVFALGEAFGSLPPGHPLTRPLRLPYRQADAFLKGIDDPASRYYNQIVDLREITQADWQQCEDLLRDDARYTLAIEIAHNASPVQAGLGSCIFMHVWGGPGVATAGCTAMALDDLARIAAWLDPAAMPCLVQLPVAAYRKHAAEWRLPPLPDA